MKIVNLKKVEKNPVAMEGAQGAFKQVPISRNDGSPTFSYRVFTIEPGGFTPYHNHPSEHLNYVIEGEGYLVNEKGDHQPINQGDFILVKPDEKHQYRNRSDQKNFVMICGVPIQYE